eukprot:30591_1
MGTCATVCSSDGQAEKKAKEMYMTSRPEPKKLDSQSITDDEIEDIETLDLDSQWICSVCASHNKAISSKCGICHHTQSETEKDKSNNALSDNTPIPFIPHMSMKEAAALQIGDEVDKNILTHLNVFAQKDKILCIKSFSQCVHSNRIKNIL